MKYSIPIICDLVIEIFKYYLSTYPFLRFVGTFRRIKRHLKILWFGKSRGRPPIPEPVISLVLDMKKSNLNWGSKRISQELALMGLLVSREAIRLILRDNGFYPPKLKFTPPSWASLLESYKSVFAMNFTCVHDLFGKQIFILVVLDHISRELILINATLNPCKEWVIQNIRNFHFDYDPPEAMIFDRDGIYDNWLKEYLQHQFDIEPLRLPPRCPWWNGRVERFHKTLKDEFISRLEYISFNQLLPFFGEYKLEYNRNRPHQSLNGQSPVGKYQPEVISLDQVRSYKKIKMVHGLVTRFELAS